MAHASKGGAKPPAPAARRRRTAKPAAAEPIAARGRLRSHFRPLPAERKLLEACAIGAEAEISQGAPDASRPDVVVRGAFLRFLALGGDKRTPIHEQGIQLRGAFIAEELDLRGTTVGVPLTIINCRFEKTIQLDGATLSNLTLDGSKVPGIVGFGVKAGSILLRHGFQAAGRVSLMNLRSEGRLDCENARFENRGGVALTVSGGRIAADVFLNNGFVAVGKVNLSNVDIGGQLNCEKATFDGGDDDALICDCAVVRRSFIFRDVVKVVGPVSLTGARAEGICDDAKSWQAPLTLDGFCYERIDSGPTEADSRIRWLKLQRPERHDDIFWPQPWEQAAKVLRTMGHNEAAKQILIEKQREMRRLGLIGRLKPREDLGPIHRPFAAALVGVFNVVARFSHRLYGWLAGYGYRPMRTVAWMIAMCVLATAVYSWGESRALFAPRAAGLLSDDRFAQCAAPPAGWTHCPELPAGYNTFDPLMFSLDALLPVVDLKQETDWAPVLRRGQGWRAWDGLIVRGMMWAEILFGWITSLLLASAVGRLVQKD